MTVVGSIPGIHQIYFELSGPNVAAFQFPVFTVQANVQKRTLSVDPIPTLIAGVPSPQITSQSLFFQSSPHFHLFRLFSCLF
jgi:hypothetical protein